jgi:hypothetical protein
MLIAIREVWTLGANEQPLAVGWDELKEIVHKRFESVRIPEVSFLESHLCRGTFSTGVKKDPSLFYRP